MKQINLQLQGCSAEKPLLRPCTLFQLSNMVFFFLKRYIYINWIPKLSQIWGSFFLLIKKSELNPLSCKCRESSLLFPHFLSFLRAGRRGELTHFCYLSGLSPPPNTLVELSPSSFMPQCSPYIRLLLTVTDLYGKAEGNYGTAGKSKSNTGC